MPTATMTTQDTPLQSPTVIPLKSTPSSSIISAAATLRSLYPRAAKAFLHRDVTLTHSLLTSAFAILRPPNSFAEDALATLRRKWDILRITFETTFYASPPTSEDPEALPAPLRANQMLSPQSLVTLLHTRSLQLFTPSSPVQKPSAAFLPHQILVTLVLASLKTACPEVGRQTIEDWLAKRSPSSQDLEGYTKVMELYCLQVLPALEEWGYASEFLQYEPDLPPDTRQHLISTLQTLHTQAQTRSRPQSLAPREPSISPGSAESSRSVSPAPSISSESSSSTQTATPLSPRPRTKSTKGKTNGRLPSVPPLTPSSSISSSSSSQSVSSTTTSKTVTPRSVGRANGVTHKLNGKANGHAIHDLSSSSASPKSSISPLPRPPRSHSLYPPSTTSSSTTPSAPSTLTIIRSWFDWSQLTSGMTKSRALTFIFFVVVLPLVSFLIRLRSRRRKAIAESLKAGAGSVVTSASSSGAVTSAAEEVRRRLQRGQPGAGGNIVIRIWEEIVRAVGDTVRMGGRGLV